MERFAIDEVLCFKVSKGLPSFFFRVRVERIEIIQETLGKSK